MVMHWAGTFVKSEESVGLVEARVGLTVGRTLFASGQNVLLAVVIEHV